MLLAIFFTSSSSSRHPIYYILSYIFLFKRRVRTLSPCNENAKLAIDLNIKRKQTTFVFMHIATFGTRHGLQRMKHHRFEKIKWWKNPSNGNQANSRADARWFALCAFSILHAYFPIFVLFGLFFTSYLHRCMQSVRFQKKIVLFLTVLKFQFKQKVAEKNETKPSCSLFAKQTYVHYLFIHWIFIIISNIYLLKIMQKKWEDHNRHRKKNRNGTKNMKREFSGQTELPFR